MPVQISSNYSRRDVFPLKLLSGTGKNNGPRRFSVNNYQKIKSAPLACSVEAALSRGSAIWPHWGYRLVTAAPLSALYISAGCGIITLIFHF
jgi:hypothetical protein